MSDEITIWECSEREDETMPVDDLIAALIRARDAAPKGSRPMAKFWCAGDYAHAYMEVQYTEAGGGRE